jgi:hypothetical protein
LPVADDEADSSGDGEKGPESVGEDDGPVENEVSAVAVARLDEFADPEADSDPRGDAVRKPVIVADCVEKNVADAEAEGSAVRESLDDDV